MMTVRLYRHGEDRGRVGAFVVRMASADAPYQHWLPARWETMHSRPMLDRDHLDRFDVWEEGGAIVGEAPGGEFASFCGMWYDAVNRVASTEPVAAGPHFRGRGLGTAAVMEGVRICPAVGTRVAYVGADQPFSLAMGFGVCRRHRLWRKVIEPAFGAEPGTQPPLEES